MNNSVLLDTSFLISLVDDTRGNHAKAKGFYKYFIDNKMHMILSSIVTSEFCIKQSLTDLPISNFRTLPFNIPDSFHLSAIFEDKFRNYNTETSRNSVKDDYKIVSQCNFNKIEYLITEDEPLCKLITNLNTEHKTSIKPLYLPDGHETSFNIQVALF
jgi:hypothetical protein